MNRSKPDADDAGESTKMPRRQKPTKSKKPPSKLRAKFPSSCLYESPNFVEDTDALTESLRGDGLADQDWFDKHPRSTYRVRLATPLEQMAFQFEGLTSAVVLFRGPGSHRRIYYTEDELAALIVNATSLSNSETESEMTEVPFPLPLKRKRQVQIVSDVLV